MNPRFLAIDTIGKRQSCFACEKKGVHASDYFGKYVFNRSVMRNMLPEEIYQNVVNALEGREKIKPEFADPIAVAIKDWAMELGATHYTHLFQPLTGATAEKHDAFIDWSSVDQVIEKFSGKQLIQGEPDASSFPSGGLRNTFEARGYTGWDPSSPVFVWKAGDGVTLCIPSVFFSWTGHVLDNKIPLLRSDAKVSSAIMRLLAFTGIKADNIHTTIGLEQEYFVVDRAFRDLRPDLITLGKTVYGASPPKGQELQDHYFGSVKDRILNFMREFEVEALKLGIPVKTRHNEVAPGQHEVAPVFEKASIAIDHNIVLMELMRQVAIKHDLSCLLHEKPFEGLNGSGKHCNWSLVTNTGINLIDPTDTPENNLHFLIILTAVLHAVHEHANLLRCSIGSAGNDYRLGGHEAPPAIMSVYLGDQLEEFLDNIEKTGAHTSIERKKVVDLGLWALPELCRDNTDRNRTSPFAFTGNKFEMRALGSSASPAFLVTVLNVMVADSLTKMLDEIETEFQGKAINPSSFAEAAIPVVQRYLKESRNVRYSGNNYSEEWIADAKQRKLSNITKSVESFEALLDSATIRAFDGILNKNELEGRYEISMETYATISNIEANLMRELFFSQILPVAIKQQKEMAESLSQLSLVISAKKITKKQKKYLSDFTVSIENALILANELEALRQRAMQMDNPERARYFSVNVVPKGKELRKNVDEIEAIVDDQLWPLPKYRELLFIF